MKKSEITSILVVAFCLILYACEGNVEQKSTPYKLNGGVDVEIVIIDSCEYLLSGVGYSQMITHKGNCKFCAKRNSTHD